MAPYRLAFIIGTRPEAIKLAPVIKAAQQRPMIKPVVICTGQHTDMVQPIIDLFDIQPDINLDLMTPNQSLSNLTATSLQTLNAVLGELMPDMVIVQGDTTSAFCGALASFYLAIPVAHVEAGLRSFNNQAPYPEEMNRKCISAIASIHYAPTKQSVSHLQNEGLPTTSIIQTGNTGIDAALTIAKSIKTTPPKLPLELAKQHDPTRPLVLITTHRREHIGDPLLAIISAIRILATTYTDHQFLIPIHQNPRIKTPILTHLSGLDNIIICPPLAYDQLLWLMMQCTCILTDSGGIQEEAPSFKKPVFVLRESTERQEGITHQCAQIVGTKTNRIVTMVSQFLSNKANDFSFTQNPYGDGTSSEKILDHIQDWLINLTYDQ